MFSVNKNPTKKDIFWFAIGMLVFVPAIASYMLWKMQAPAEGAAGTKFNAVGAFLWVIAVLGPVVGVAAIASPAAGRKLFVAWMTVMIPIGIAVSTVMLTVLYFVLLPVFSLIVRRKDPLRKKLGGTTYWEDYKPCEHSLERMQRPF